jgi:hypothetical protein
MKLMHEISGSLFASKHIHEVVFWVTIARLDFEWYERDLLDMLSKVLNKS